MTGSRRTEKLRNCKNVSYILISSSLFLFLFLFLYPGGVANPQDRARAHTAWGFSLLGAGTHENTFNVKRLGPATAAYSAKFSFDSYDETNHLRLRYFLHMLYLSTSRILVRIDKAVITPFYHLYPPFSTF